MRLRLFQVIIPVLLGILLSSAVLAAEGHKPSFGIKAGAGINPDQFVVGVQGVFRKALDFADFAPSADLGFGDNVTVITLNPDLRLPLSLPASQTFFYVQAGPTIAILDFKYGKSDTEIGLTLSAGLEFPMGKSGYYSLEGRFGLGDVPDARILFGILLGGRSSR
jgi:hypothetical protein